MVREYNKEDTMTDIEELERREREAYEAFIAADWRTAAERLGEWLDAWCELREAREAER